MLPGRPDNSREAIGQSHGGFVVTTLALAIERPTAQMIECVSGALGTMRTEQRGSSTVYDEGSQVDIALLGDFSEPALLRTRALVGRKAQPGREVTARRKSLDIPDDGA